MAFFLRKALKLGPLRLNLSKSGVGVSAGVTGARLGIRADGQPYVYGGRHGLYYRQNLGSLGNDPQVDRAAEAITELLDQTADDWLPAIRTLQASSAGESAKRDAGEAFHQNTKTILDHLKSLGFPIGPEEDAFSRAVSEIHSDLVLMKAFPEQYEAWDSTCDDLLSRATKEAKRIVKKHEAEMLTKLRNRQPLIEVINELGEKTIMPHLKSKVLVLEDNPVYAMRLGSAVSNTILNDLLECIPAD